MMQWCPRRTLSETWGEDRGNGFSGSGFPGFPRFSGVVLEPGQQLLPAFLELVVGDQVFVPELMQFLQSCF